MGRPRQTPLLLNEPLSEGSARAGGLADGCPLPGTVVAGGLAAGLPNEAAIGLSYEQLDSALWAMEHGWPDERILAGAEISAAALAAIRQAMRVARIREELPLHL